MLLQKNVKDYIERYGARESHVLDQLRIQTQTMPEHKMQVGPELAHTLCFLINTIQAERVLEIGTYTGYSSLAMALNTPENTKITTCDHNVEWTKIAQKYWQQAGVDHKIQLCLGEAEEVLNGLANKWHRFDFIFIDADKKNYPMYFEKAQQLLRPGGLIAIDNTLWDGEVAQDERDDIGNIMHELNVMIHTSQQFDFMLLPIDDGLTVVRKRAV